MDLTLSTVVPLPADRVRPAVDDLGTYPNWMGLVHRAEVVDGGWLVDIGARIGLLRPTKRLRMARTEPLRFERQELDGKEHPAWVLRGEITDAGALDRCRLTMHLHYSGAPPIPGIDLVLSREASRAGRRLASYLASAP